MVVTESSTTPASFQSCSTKEDCPTLIVDIGAMGGVGYVERFLVLVNKSERGEDYYIWGRGPSF